MGVDKSDMIPTSRAASDEKALYNTSFKKEKGIDLRSTNFSLGTSAMSYTSAAADTYKRHGTEVYEAAKNRANTNNQASNITMGHNKCDWKTTAVLADEF